MHGMHMLTYAKQESRAVTKRPRDAGLGQLPANLSM